MDYNISKPSLLLSKYVKQYWAMENCIPKGKEHIQRIVPNGLSDLIFYLSDKPESIKEKKSISDNTIITGQLSEYYDIKITGKVSLFSVIFQPHGLSMFFDIPLNELLNQNVPLKYILKDGVGDVETKLHEAHSFTERIEIMELFLIERLQECKHKYHFNRIKDSISLINQNKGLVSIDKLANEACLSRKQYERTFSNLIGTSPKKFLKTIRFQNALNEKSKDKNINLTSLTYQCGYYDQSHMTNDFYKLSGLTPKQYFDDCETYSDYFQ